MKQALSSGLAVYLPTVERSLPTPDVCISIARVIKILSLRS